MHIHYSLIHAYQDAHAYNIYAIIHLYNKRLLIFSFRSLRMPLPAAEISAPESGRALVRVEPLEEVMLTLTFGQDQLR